MSIRVLAVDDEPDVLRLVEVKLKKAGFEVLTARDGEEGLKKR
jgi:two-component system, OmpR family, alkaline phosphatase synthesis response regulator PhoP